MIHRSKLKCTALTLILLMAGMLVCMGAVNAAMACCVPKGEVLTPCCCEIESQAALPALSDSGLFIGFGAVLPAIPVLFAETPQVALARSLQHQALTPNQRRRYLDLGRLLN